MARPVDSTGALPELDRHGYHRDLRGHEAQKKEAAARQGEKRSEKK